MSIPQFDHAPEPTRFSYIAYGAGEALEFSLYIGKKTKAQCVERAKYEARWQMRPKVIVRWKNGAIIYDGVSTYA